MAKSILVIRTPSGLSGDMLVTGLARLAGRDETASQAIAAERSSPGALDKQSPQAILDALLSDVGLPELSDAARLQPRAVSGIAGWGLSLALPHSHEHRHLADVTAIIHASRLSKRAKHLACRTFSLLARAEGAVHGIAPELVHFHEVGALDSILDVCLTCALFDRLSPDVFVCSPLPVCDGQVQCAHGLLSTPAPATLKLLEGLPVYGVDSCGETLTPTAVALLKALDARFGPWPPMVIERQERAYGTRVLPGVPNGALFALGQAHKLAVEASPAHAHAHGDEAPAATSPAHPHAHGGHEHG